MAQAKKRGRSKTSVQALEPTSYNSRGTKFILSLKWDDLWKEFASELNENGHLKYATAYAFVRAKAKTLEETDWMWRAIGPKPELAEGEKPPIPWIGDFMRQRENGFWPNSEHTKAVLKMLQTQCDAAPIARGLSRVNTRALVRIEGLYDQVDAFFNGTVFDPSLDLASNEKRFRLFMDCMERIHQHIYSIQKVILKCHGVDLDDLNFKVMKDTAAAVGAVVAAQGGSVEVTQTKTTLSAEVPGAVAPEDQPLAMRMMAMFAKKAKLFDQPIMGEPVGGPSPEPQKSVDSKTS